MPSKIEYTLLLLAPPESIYSVKDVGKLLQTVMSLMQSNQRLNTATATSTTAATIATIITDRIITTATIVLSYELGQSH